MTLKVTIKAHEPAYRITNEELRRMFEAAIANHPVLSRITYDTVSVEKVDE